MHYSKFDHELSVKVAEVYFRLNDLKTFIDKGKCSDLIKFLTCPRIISVKMNAALKTDDHQICLEKLREIEDFISLLKKIADDNPHFAPEFVEVTYLLHAIEEKVSQVEKYLHTN